MSIRLVAPALAAAPAPATAATVYEAGGVAPRSAAASSSTSGLDVVPQQSSRMNRYVSHLAAVAAPLATLASSGLSGDRLASSLQVGQALASGLTAGLTSLTTHEHHFQTQEMSRQLQQKALEQDMTHHQEGLANAAKLHKENIDQDREHHREALQKAQRQHLEGIRQERRLYQQARRVDHRLHFEGILADLREQDREADRDLWEQRTERFQMLMTVSSLLISGGFVLVVEGQLPPTSGCLVELRNGSCQFEVAALHYFLLAWGFGCELCVIMGCLALTSRFAEFMDLRVQKQQLMNKNLRRIAVHMLGKPDDDMLCADSSLYDGAGMSGGGGGGGGSGGDGGGGGGSGGDGGRRFKQEEGMENIRDMEDIRDMELAKRERRDEKYVGKFDRVLRQQYVIETCKAGSSGRHIWNFSDWFSQRCSTLAMFVETCFRACRAVLAAQVTPAPPPPPPPACSWLRVVATTGPILLTPASVPLAPPFPLFALPQARAFWVSLAHCSRLRLRCCSGATMKCLSSRDLRGSSSVPRSASSSSSRLSCRRC